MPPSFPPLRTLLPAAETLLIAAVGGTVFTLIGFPAGLVAGSMLAVAVAALVGRPMQVPLALARVCFVLVGILLGAVVTPETLAGIAAWPGSIAILALAVIAMLARPRATCTSCMDGTRCRRCSAPVRARWRRCWRWRPSWAATCAGSRSCTPCACC
jgi:hypothetical protein